MLATLCCLTATAQDKKFLYASAATYPFASDFYYTEPDSNFYVFLCFGQSNMQGAARPEDKDDPTEANALKARIDQLGADPTLPKNYDIC